MAYAMNCWMLDEGFTEVLGVHRTDNYDTIAATRAKGVVRLGTVTRERLLWHNRFTFEPEAAATPRIDGHPAVPAAQLADGGDYVG